MEILKVETRTRWFGLRSDLYMLVAGSVDEGDPEDHWVKVDQFTLKHMALSMARSRDQVEQLLRQVNQMKKVKDAREYTLKELSATVADAVERTVSAHPSMRMLLDKVDKVGRYASGGLVGEPLPTYLSEAALARARVKDSCVGDGRSAEATATSEVNTRVCNHQVQVEICKGDKPFVVGMGLGVQETVAQQIREEAVRNTSLDEPPLTSGISATPQDRLSHD